MFLLGCDTATLAGSQSHEEILWHENFDIDHIFTHVNGVRFAELLRQAKYPESKVKFIEEGFSSGFSLNYEGPSDVKMESSNLKLRIGNKVELWNKVMKEVGEKRYTGPFEQVPYDSYIQSPIGLVPKDGGRKTRLIFHLSYPRNTGTSVNANIPVEKCKVVYPDFDEAVQMCIKAGINCNLGKSDMSAAFRHMPLKVCDYKYLIMKAQHPVSLKYYYFIDKCLPFGSSVSCLHFQAISDAIAYVVAFRNHNKDPLNYLDDFLFVALMKYCCDEQIRNFLQVCEEINFPVAMDKTFWGTPVLIFLGLLLDAERQLVCVPAEKIAKAMEMINYFTDRKNKKVTVHQLQQLCGYLNFLCRCIIPGRAFMTRLYSHFTGLSKLKPYHHLRIKEESRLDLMVWKQFLSTPQAFCRPFMDAAEIDAETRQMYSDASGKIGMGAICYSSRMYTAWPEDFLKEKPTIEYLELYALVAGVLRWGHRFKNRRVRLFCDNMGVVHMVNNNSAHGKNCMILIRTLVLESLKQNVRIFAKYINTKANGIPDSLSRLDLDRFRKLSPHMEDNPVQIPNEIWPVRKVWTGKEE